MVRDITTEAQMTKPMVVLSDLRQNSHLGEEGTR